MQFVLLSCSTTVNWNGNDDSGLEFEYCSLGKSSSMKIVNIYIFEIFEVYE